MAVKIDNRLKDVMVNLQKAIEKSAEEIGQLGAAHAQSIAPVDTGQLRRSISYVADKNQVVIGSDVEYSAAVEFGTSKKREQPYLRPAIEGNVAAFEQIVAKNLSKVGDGK